MAIVNSGRIKHLKEMGVPGRGLPHPHRSSQGDLSPAPINAALVFDTALNNFNPEEKPMDSSDSKINRREFLQRSAVVAAGSAALSSTALSYSRIAGANDRISLRSEEHKSELQSPG